MNGALSIPLNGFQGYRGGGKPGNRGLSIPLNGFCEKLTIDDLLMDIRAFNSIEWIPLCYALEPSGVPGLTFNSIEWIP